MTIEKMITGYAYPRNGNVHNPTPRVLWVVKDEFGRIVDNGYRLKELKRTYPSATVKGSRR